MQIARLQNEKSVAEFAARVYGLKAGDPRTATALQALVAANPHLSAKLATLPGGTPVIVPAPAGLTIQSGAAVDPNRAAWSGALDQILQAAQQAANATQTGSFTTVPTKPNPQLTKAVALLTEDIAKFKRLHRG